MRVDVRVTFDGGRVGRRAYLVPPGGDWSLSLDEVYAFPGATDMVDVAEVERRVRGVMTNARIRIECDGACQAEKAVYYAPIGQGAPALQNVLFQCGDPR